jgi:hypothetical protein
VRRKSALVGTAFAIVFSLFVIRARINLLTFNDIGTKLRYGMTIPEIEGRLHKVPPLQPRHPDAYYSTIITSNFLSRISPQDEVTLFFDRDKRLTAVLHQRVRGCFEIQENWIDIGTPKIYGSGI